MHIKNYEIHIKLYSINYVNEFHSDLWSKVHSVFLRIQDKFLLFLFNKIINNRASKAAILNILT